MQPHEPYLSVGPLDEGLSNRRKKEKDNEGGVDGIGNKIRFQLGPIAEKLLGRKTIRFIRTKLGLRELTEPELLARKKGKEALREEYKKNLRIALREVKVLLESIPGKKIISSDHGELLGEKDLYGHFPVENSIIKEVPWLEVEEEL